MKKIFALVCIAVFCLSNYAQSVSSNGDSAISVDYNKWANTTWYSTNAIYFEFGWSQSDINVNAAFVCNGKTSFKKPCKTIQVYLLFRYSYPYNHQMYKPFDSTHRSVQAFTDGRRIFLGEAKVNFDGNSGKYIGAIAISLTQFRQLATAKSLEVSIGVLASDKMDNTPFNTLYRYVVNPNSSFSEAKPFDINDDTPFKPPQDISKPAPQISVQNQIELEGTVKKYDMTDDEIYLLRQLPSDKKEKVRNAIAKIGLALSTASTSDDVEGDVSISTNDALETVESLEREIPIGRFLGFVKGSSHALEASLALRLLSIPSNKFTKGFTAVQKARMEQQIVTEFSLSNVSKTERSKVILAIGHLALEKVKDNAKQVGILE